MITNKIKHTALLSRLSREDDLQGDSESIQTQKAMLEQYASKNVPGDGSVARLYLKMRDDSTDRVQFYVWC